MKTAVISTALTVALAAAPALANFYPTFPVGDSVWPAGSEQTIAWQDNGQAPNIKDISSFKLELQTGTDSNQVTLATIGTNLQGSTGSVKFTIPASIGPSGKVYFLRFTPSSGDIVWTTRFTLTGGTGTFGSNVQLPPGSTVGGSASQPTSSPSSNSSDSSNSTDSKSTVKKTTTVTPSSNTTDSSGGNSDIAFAVSNIAVVLSSALFVGISALGVVLL